MHLCHCLQFLEGLKTVWVRPGSASFLHTAFIVLGPIPEEKSVHLTTGTIIGHDCDAIMKLLA